MRCYLVPWHPFRSSAPSAGTPPFTLSLLSPSVFCSPLRCNRMRQMCFSGSSNQNAITHDHAAGSHRPSSRSPSPLPSSRLLPSRFPPRRLRRRQVPGANWLDRKRFFSPSDRGTTGILFSQLPFFPPLCCHSFLLANSIFPGFGVLLGKSRWREARAAGRVGD